MINATQTVSFKKIFSQSICLPRIQTDHLDLEELTDEEASCFFRRENINTLTKSVMWETHVNTQESLNYIQELRKVDPLEKDQLFLCWGVKEKGSSSLIGSVNLTQIGPICAQIGFVFHHDWWTRSLPVEALRAILNWSFSEYPSFERVQATCLPSSVDSTSLLERTGMTCEGTNRAMMKIQDKIVDFNCYAMTRKQWQNMTSSSGAWTLFQHQMEGHI